MACIAAQQTEEEMGIDGRDFYVVSASSDYETGWHPQANLY